MRRQRTMADVDHTRDDLARRKAYRATIVSLAPLTVGLGVWQPDATGAGETRRRLTPDPDGMHTSIARRPARLHVMLNPQRGSASLEARRCLGATVAPEVRPSHPAQRSTAGPLRTPAPGPYRTPVRG